MTRKNRLIPRIDLANSYKLKINNEFGIVSDTHLGSKYNALDELQYFYDILYDEGITQVFHAGDLSDGVNVYKGQMYEQVAWGFDDQINYIVKNYPRRKGIKTYWIEGNHDTSYYNQIGASLGSKLNKLRDDLICLGMLFARVYDDISIDILHLRKSRAYAVSYPLQAYLRELPPSRHPDILILGHRHHAYFGLFQDTYCFEAGNFQYVTPYALERGKGQPVAGWIVRIERERGKIKKISPTLINFGYKVMRYYPCQRI